MSDQEYPRSRVNRRRFMQGSAAATATVFGMPWQLLAQNVPSEFDGSKFQLKAPEPNPKSGGVLKYAITSRPPHFGTFFHPEAMADYLTAARNPDMIRGMCEDYRAAATIDLEHDRASRAAGAKIQCPLLVLWGAEGKIAKWYDALAIWRQYCSAEVTGAPVKSGHYLAEEAPAEVLTHFRGFFG